LLGRRLLDPNGLPECPASSQVVGAVARVAAGKIESFVTTRAVYGVFPPVGVARTMARPPQLRPEATLPIALHGLLP